MKSTINEIKTGNFQNSKNNSHFSASATRWIEVSFTRPFLKNCANGIRLNI